jgi:hypothetical protein
MASYTITFEIPDRIKLEYRRTREEGDEPMLVVYLHYRDADEVEIRNYKRILYHGLEGELPEDLPDLPRHLSPSYYQILNKFHQDYALLHPW